MAELKLVAVNHRTAEQFAKLINEKWQEQVSSIIEVGLLLQTAKEELKHGEWLKMLKDSPFGANTAQRLMAIADHESLSNTATWPHLPAAWRILYELSQLTSEQFDAALAAGNIHPKMRIKDAKELRGIVSKPKRKTDQPKPSSDDDPIAGCYFDVRERISQAMIVVGEDGRSDLLNMLEKMVKDLREAEGA